MDREQSTSESQSSSLQSSSAIEESGIKRSSFINVFPEKYILNYFHSPNALAQSIKLKYPNNDEHIIFQKRYSNNL